MYNANLIGVATTRTTATGYRAITSGNANIIGILCASSATATGGCQLFAAQATVSGTTSGGTAISPLLVFASGSVAQFIQVPMYASGGFAINIGAAANPDITLFWNPA